MPEEMVRFAKENILEQVNSTILAQANQSTSGVLSLLNS
jgi:flagellin-like hook-associated protein FlgL